MSSNDEQNVVNENSQNGGDAALETATTETTETTTTETATAETAVKEKPKTRMKAPEQKIYSLDEVQDEMEYSEDEFKEMVDLYDQTMTDFVEGELIVGKILAVNDKDVAVDIGFKSEGVIPLEEFNDPKSIVIGEDIEVYLDNVEDSEGQLVLSKTKADFLRMWERVIVSHENDETIQGVCVRRIKGGIVVDLNGVDAFLPGSQIDVKPIRDFDALIGREMDFKIVKVNESRKNIVVSHRVLVEEGMKEQRQEILQNLEKNQVLEGTVKNITDFGVFIDLGGVDGLLHINDLSWGRVNHPSEIVALDEKIKIQILDFNEQKDRISLGLKQLMPHPWDGVKDKYNVDDVIKGKVVNIADYGAFMELEKGVEGLIHISEMSWTQHIKHPSKILSLGETVEAKILNIDHEGRKVSLGLKQLEPDPWADIGVKYPLDSKQKGVVRNLTNFGAFVELEEGVDGLIHISDLSWTKKVRHPGEVVKKNEDVEVVVLNIDKDNRRISLGYKQTMDNPWEKFEDEFKPETKKKGKIVRMIEKGVIVELPGLVDGFVPMSQLAKQGIRKPADGYQVGDDLDLVVIEFNRENKKIILSEKHADSTELKDVQVEVDPEAIAEFEKEMATPEKVTPAAKKSATAKKAKEVVAEVSEETEVEEEAKSEDEESSEAKAEVAEEVQADDAAISEETAEAAAEKSEEVVAEVSEETEVEDEAKSEDEESSEAKAEVAEEVQADDAAVSEETAEAAAEKSEEVVAEVSAETEVEDEAKSETEPKEEEKKEK